MILFPLLHRLEVSEYGMFKREEDTPALILDFEKTPTIVIGINGVGKTTLITIILRLLTGPFDLSRRGSGESLGQVKPKPVTLGDPRIFRKRVADGAVNATAKLEFKLGVSVVKITRNLEDLSLDEFEIDGVDKTDLGEGGYQSTISNMMGVASFFDVILVLKHLIFYLEDRRLLVWDPTAQYHLLRVLFLDSKKAASWTEFSSQIVAADSTARNLYTILNRREKELESALVNVNTVTDIRAELNGLRAIIDADESKLAALEAELEVIESAREEARLHMMRARGEREECLRGLERMKMQAISVRFPDSSETARYILTHLMSEGICLLCGSSAGVSASELTKNLDEGFCVVCKTEPAMQKDIIIPEDVDKHRIKRAKSKLKKAIESVGVGERDLAEYNDKHNVLIKELAEIQLNLRQRKMRKDAFARKLPPDEQELETESLEISALWKEHERLLNERKAAEAQFGTFVKDLSLELESKWEKIRDVFARYATDFLVEECRLVYKPRKDKIGQVGAVFDFPAFSMEMSGGAISGLVLRDGPDEVSESQREFIDLAFRMALMAVASDGNPTTMVIDAPEGSLDMIFSKRAGQLLTLFGGVSSESDNRLILTTNLVKSGLLPALLEDIKGTEERWARIVNLIEVASPNAAILKFGEEYRQGLREIVEGKSTQV